MTFKEQVEKEIENLSREQQVAFAWRCAVRALPYLGSKGHFDFWEKEDRLKHLNSILFALDKSIADPYQADDFIDVTDVSIAIVRSDNTTTAVKNIGYAAAYAKATSQTSFHSSNEFTTHYYAARAAENAAINDQIYFEDIIFNDIQSIKIRKRPTIDLSTYGEIWDNFKLALKKENCAYWGEVYQKIFENDFQIDLDELKTRLNVPKEIRDEGASAVANYLKSLEKGAERLNESRVIILGEKGVGKTCVARKLKDPNADMTTSEESTAGVDTTLWEIPENEMKVRIWDFAGHTVTHAVHQFFLSERCLYIMVYDGRSESRNRLEYWLDHMKNHGGDSQAFILINERDKHKIKIPINNLKEKYKIKELFTFNIGKDKTKLEEFRQAVIDYLNHHASWKNQVIPKSYYDVKEALEKRFQKKEKEKGEEHISKVEFDRIAKECDAEDPDKLLQALNALGISLWYDDMEKYDTLILNPEWISNGVYSIINWVSNADQHEIQIKDFVKVFQEEEALRYPKEKHEFLFDLIKHYELAYETGKGKRLVIPHLLGEDQPDELPAFVATDSLMMRYEADRLLPPNTISRFIVRHNEQIQKKGKDYLVWKFGVVLSDGENLALVREVDRTIQVSVKGVGKTNYISSLRETLNDIFKSYATQHPKLNYKVIENELIPAQQDLWLPEQEIAALAKLDKPYFYYPTNSNIPMQPTVINYNITRNVFHVSGGDSQFLLGQNNQVNNTTFNFHNCNIELQGSLNNLARKLRKSGNIEDAEEIEDAIEVLDEIEEGATKEEVKKKGVAKKLQEILEDMGDKNSTLNKTLEGLKKGKKMAQDVAKQYNKMADWLMMPRVPEVFLGKEKEG